MHIKKIFVNKNIVYFHLVICILIMAFFWLLDPIEPITALGMKVLGVFLGLLYGWNTAGFLWPSLLGILAFVQTGYMNMNETLAAGFGSNTCILLMFAFIFLSILDESGASRFIALWIITRKCFKGKPWLLSLAFFLGSYGLCCVTTAVATIVLCWSILYTLCESVGYQPGDKYPTAMVIGVVYACEIGSVALPWRANPLLLMGTYESLTNTTINYLQYIAVTIPVAILCVSSYIFLCKFIFRIDASKLSQVDISTICRKEDLQLSKEQKFGLFFLICMVICMILPSITPTSFIIGKILNDEPVEGML